MTPQERIDWMNAWCDKHALRLDVEGEVGFGRECVGIVDDDHLATEYVEWDYGTPGEQEGNTAPRDEAPDAYHKHNCLAILGRGDEAERQLYEWVKRLDEQGAVIVRDVPKAMPDLASLFGKTTRTMIVTPERADVELLAKAY